MLTDRFQRLPLRLRPILWFVFLWCAGLVALSAVAYAIRSAIMP